MTIRDIREFAKELAGDPYIGDASTCPRCRATDDSDHPIESGPFVDNLGDGEHVCCTRCGFCWQPFGEHEWPCAVCCAGTDDAQYVVNAALARDVQRLRKESASFEARWREAGDRAMSECGRRQQLESDLRGMLASPPEAWRVSGMFDMLRRFIESSSRGLGHELAVPLSRVTTEGAREILRVWTLPDDTIMVALDGTAGLAARAGRDDDDEREYEPARWGVLLHDVAKNVATWYASRMEDENGNCADPDNVITLIETRFAYEAVRPTSDARELRRD
jgi:hypothetical protein